MASIEPLPTRVVVLLALALAGCPGPNPGPDPVNLTLRVTGEGSVRVSATAESCSGTCELSAELGSSITLTAQPERGHSFALFGDDCAEATGLTCTLEMTEDRIATAVFVPDSVGITVATTGTGAGRVVSTPAGIDCGTDCEEELSPDSPITLTATAEEGSDFVGWGQACEHRGASASCALMIVERTVVTAEFALRRYDVEVTLAGAGGGTVSSDVGGIDCGSTCIASVAHGEMITLSAAADSASVFAGWTGDCAHAATATDCTISVEAMSSVTASFERAVADLDVVLSGTGDGTVTGDGIDCGSDCAETYAVGTLVTLTAAAGAGSSFAGWSGACAAEGTNPTCDVTMDMARSVGAQFALPQYTLTVNIIAGGGAGGATGQVMGTTVIDCGADCSELVDSGTTIDLLPTATAGTRFVGWTTDDGTCVGTTQCSLLIDRDRTVDGNFIAFVPTRLSDTDRDPLATLRPDDQMAIDLYHRGGARSDRGVAPGSGVFYFEGRRLSDEMHNYGFGVAAAGDSIVNFMGASDQCFGANTDGSMWYDGAWQGNYPRALNDTYGFVVDYRGVTPIVHFIANLSGPGGGTPSVIHTQAMPNVNTDVFILVTGTRRVVGYEAEINPGNDTVAFPFTYDPDAVLRGAGLDSTADALVLGWGQSFSGPNDAAPAVTPSADMAVTAGTPVTVTATATDAEDGDLTASIEWELLSSPHYAGRLRGSGGSFSFTPTAIGFHPAQATVLDSIGQRTVVTVMVEVTGTVVQHDPVILVPDAQSGVGIELSPDSLSARWTGAGKMGIRANQSLYGEFWYFEIERLVAPVNMGGGLVVGDGNLNPYSWADVPPSCSINTGGAVWHNIISQGNFPDVPATYTHYGFAVDYRGTHPIVYVILNDAVVNEVVLDDVWVELYPVLYGNPTGLSMSGEYDERINFGSPFVHDAAAALSAYGVDTSAFELGWGDANTP